MADKPQNAEAGNENESRRRRPIEMPPELDSRFLRVGDKLYRTAHDKVPVATITPDRIKAKDRESLPDLIRLAKENGWTSIKISGDEEFKRAAFLAASAQGIAVDGYRPDEKTKAAAERDQARQAGSVSKKQPTTRTANQARDTKEGAEPRTDLAERFRRQSDVQNAKDPELRKAQSQVAFAMSVAEGRFPGDPAKQREFVAERKEDVAARIGRGEQIAGIEIRAKQDQRVREIEQTQILQKSRTIGGR
ncbi:DNA primase (plasmid) [Sphingobium sp. LB126]|uniref:LPD7 domain-containing protein n=1 Tax=Sphingobium sp. LB126 TaxID=1983755 RepID=UPI000C207941|nr:LPD7 domain-containing protein [Sphingobium sp. LB126]PJG45031.1 DNA primase [Sphingobium sp. LB126]